MPQLIIVELAPLQGHRRRCSLQAMTKRSNSPLLACEIADKLLAQSVERKT